MLIEITEFVNVDARKLMDVYAESNLENTGFFFPDEADERDFGLVYRYSG